MLPQVLYAIDIESIVPTYRGNTRQRTFGLRTISGSDKGVQFFSVGRQHGRTLVIFKRRKGVSKCNKSVFSIMLMSVCQPDSVFKAIEVLPQGSKSFGKVWKARRVADRTL